MELKEVRGELDKIDNLIKNLITIRMGLIPIVAKIKIEKNLSSVQKDREKIMFQNIENFSVKKGVDSTLLKEVYKNIISNAVTIEDEIMEKSKLNEDSLNKTSLDKEMLDNFQIIDEILGNDLTNAIEKLDLILENSSLNLNELSTVFYENKLNENKN